MPTVCKHFKDLFNAFVKMRFHFTEEEIRAQEKKNPWPRSRVLQVQELSYHSSLFPLVNSRTQSFSSCMTWGNPLILCASVA